MYRSGIATFTLDYGKCPPWLFRRMVKLGREMTRVLIEEYGPDEFIKRIADPVWFQSLGTVLAFDWNASGLTTILTAALKEAIRGREREWGIFIAGGKGKTSRKTPDEIVDWGEKLGLPKPKSQSLVYNSKMAAKVDSALIQDGFQIYHHSFFFSKNGVWTVVQQGMNTQNVTARRYHWHSENIKDFVCEPHTGIVSDNKQKVALNMVSKNSAQTRDVSAELVNGGYRGLIKDIEILRKHSSKIHKTLALKVNSPYGDSDFVKLMKLKNIEFQHHPVEMEDFSKSRYLEKILKQVCDYKPENYEKLVAIKGVGPKTVRALALTSEIIYGAGPSYEDPARYSFAHGGKDATPYPIDKKTYDQTITIMRNVIKRTKLPFLDKIKIMKNLS
ncbi:DUF763 domain-containing protein [Candidatus Wolfebacteria bacterium]|nr:DUF763 domain-containing protein [Candidatus Wolfebacteria bacterium]